VEVFSGPISDLLDGYQRREVLLLLTFTETGATTISPPSSPSVFYFLPFKDSDIPASEVKVVGIKAVEDDPAKAEVRFDAYNNNNNNNN